MEFEKVQTTEDALPKSVGHSYCVPDRVNRDGKVPSVLMKLTERAGRRLRGLGMLAGGVAVTAGFRAPGFASPSGPFWTPQAGEGGDGFAHLPEPAADSFTLVGSAMNLLSDIWHNERVSFLAVTLVDLSTPTGQRRLDDGIVSWRRTDDRRRRASDAVDLIRDRYGDDAIMFGRMPSLDDEAPDRIGFRKTEGVDIIRN